MYSYTLARKMTSFRQFENTVGVEVSGNTVSVKCIFEQVL